MKTQKKVIEKFNRTPVSLTFLESVGFFCFSSVADISQDTLFSNTGQSSLLRTLKINQA